MRLNQGAVLLSGLLLYLIGHLCHVLSEVPHEVESVLVDLDDHDLLLDPLLNAPGHHGLADLLDNAVHPGLELGVLRHVVSVLNDQLLLLLLLLVRALPLLLLLVHQVQVLLLDVLDLTHRMLHHRLDLCQQIQRVTRSMDICMWVNSGLINLEYYMRKIFQQLFQVHITLI